MVKKFDLEQYYKDRIEPKTPTSPFILKITEWAKYPIPVLVVKERREVINSRTRLLDKKESVLPMALPPRYRLYDISHVSGESLRRCLGTIKQIVSQVKDEEGIPLELQRFFSTEGLKQRVNLPLDENIGAKLGLIFKLQMRVKDMDRVELLARRISTFTREEAAYWLSRVTTFGPDENRWAQAGLKIMLGGVPGDKAIDTMLKKLRGQLPLS